VFVDFSFINKEIGIPIQYDEIHEENPLFSVLSFFNSAKCPLFFTSINRDEYKYKEFPVDNLFDIAIPKENSQILYDSSKYNGWLNVDTSDSGIEPLFLNINIWNKKPLYDIEIYKSNSTDFIKDDFVFYENNIVMNKNIINNKIFEALLYKNSYQQISELNTIISECDNNMNIIAIQSLMNKHIEFNDLIQKYGDLAHELFPFRNEDEVEFVIDNRFARNKYLQKFLSEDICYWIIHESEKCDKWISGQYKLHEQILPIDNIPSVLSFILFISNYLLTSVKNEYNISNNISMNIKDIFVEKFEKNSNSQYKYKDNSFLTLTVQLNSIRDFVDGMIHFKNEPSILINQGDLFIHNGKKYRTNGGIENGFKYNLVFLIELEL
jgi:hypothetical protein